MTFLPAYPRARAPLCLLLIQMLGVAVVVTADPKPDKKFNVQSDQISFIENGEITTPLRDCNLIGNGPDVLKRVDAVANDFSMTPGTCGKDGQQVPVGTGQATMRLTGVTIGGTAA